MKISLAFVTQLFAATTLGASLGKRQNDVPACVDGALDSPEGPRQGAALSHFVNAGLDADNLQTRPSASRFATAESRLMETTKMGYAPGSAWQNRPAQG